jgi:hypothetical protein
MVSLVGITDMIPTLVNHTTYKITVFEKNEVINAQIINWMELKQGTSWPPRKSTRVDVDIVNKSNCMDTNTSDTSEENMLSPTERSEGILD